MAFSKTGGQATGAPVIAKEPQKEELRDLRAARKEACESGRL